MIWPAVAGGERAGDASQVRRGRCGQLHPPTHTPSLPIRTPSPFSQHRESLTGAGGQPGESFIAPVVEMFPRRFERQGSPAPRGHCSRRRRDDVADRERAGGQVGVPHEVKGESIYAFVTLMDGLEMTPALQKELKQVTVARSRLHFSHYPLRGLFQRISDSHPRHTFLCIVTAATCTNTRTRGFARTAGVG